MKQIINRLSLQSKILFGYVCVVIVFFATGVYVVHSYVTVRQTFIEIDTQSKKLRKLSTLESTNRKLVDVTIAFASTGELQWDVIYTDTKLSYDQLVTDLTDTFDNAEKNIFNTFLHEGIKLREMEKDIHSHIRASKIKGSEVVYANEHYEHIRNATRMLQDLMVKGNKELLSKFREADARITRLILVMSAIFILIIGMTLIFSYNISLFISRPIRELSQLVNQYSHGKFDLRVTVASQDEIGHLGEAFNEMAEKLQILYTDLAQKVSERTRQIEEKSKEFEKQTREYAEINKLMIGRELKMVELKKEIDDLKKKVAGE